MPQNKIMDSIFAINKILIQSLHHNLEKYNLDISEYYVINHLFHDGQTSIQKMAERVNLSSGTMTPLINKLVLRGYIEKKRSDSDKRKFLISITEKGNQLHNLIEREHLPDLNDMVGQGISSKELLKLEYLLDKVLHVLRK